MELTQEKLDKLQEENHRLQHLVNILIQHLGQTNQKFPITMIDNQMKLFDETFRY